MKKVPFVTKEQVEEMIKLYPTPFHLYDEKGIRETARNLYKAFSWNEGFKEYFAVKATPTPAILKILHEEGCGVDCSSMAELVMAKRCGFSEGEIMFSSNDTPLEEFTYANEIGGIINLDDLRNDEIEVIKLDYLLVNHQKLQDIYAGMIANIQYDCLLNKVLMGGIL